jgi:hypothetical protein
MQQGKAEAAAVKATAANNAQVAKYNASIQETAAKDAVVRGAEDAATIRENVKRENASARASIASSGLITDTGTPLNLLAQNRQMGETNAAQTMTNAEREAYGYRQQATGILFGSQADTANANYQANIIKSNARSRATGTLITGAADFGTSSGLFGGGKYGGGTTYHPTHGRIDWYK